MIEAKGEYRYTEAMNDNKIKYPPRMSLPLSDEEKRTVINLKAKLEEEKLKTGDEETLKEFVWSAVIKELERRKWLKK